MSTLTDFNGTGIQVVTPTPSGAGGSALNGNFKRLARSVATLDTGDPGASDDASQDFIPGARWYNTTAHTEWICLDNATGAAVWEQIPPSNPFDQPLNTTDPVGFKSVTAKTADPYDFPGLGVWNNDGGSGGQWSIIATGDANAEGGNKLTFYNNTTLAIRMLLDGATGQLTLNGITQINDLSETSPRHRFPGVLLAYDDTGSTPSISLNGNDGVLNAQQYYVQSTPGYTGDISTGVDTIHVLGGIITGIN